MKKTFKHIGIIIAVIFILLFVIICISYLNHRLQLSKEDDIFVYSGDILEVNGHDMHVYSEGSGNETLVFMSGGGTSSPYLDFKSLYSLLSDEYRIVVVEKSGYGFSEDANLSRDIDTILNETRDALSKSGYEPPYILFPHSMSGIEALYWAQEYPEEVKGIIGLDMAVPEAYDNFAVNNFMMNLGAFGSRIGITRFFPGVVDSSAAIRYGSLTEGEKELYRAVFYRRTLTRAMMNEIKEIQASANIVKEQGTPNLPIMFFISNGEETGWDKNLWVDLQKSYIDKVSLSKYVELDCSHYVHDIEFKKIAEASKEFIKEIIK